MSYDGPMLESMRAARNMVRDCHAFRRLADANNPWDEATAQSHIHFDGLPKSSSGADHTKEELLLLRPFCLLWADTSAGLRLTGGTAGGSCPLPSGTIILQFELPVPDDLVDDPDALAEDVSRKLGRIMQTTDADQPGLFELSGQAGYLPINSLELFGYIRTDAKAAHQLGDAVVGEMQLQWGMQ